MAENIILLFISHKMLKIMKHHYVYMYKYIIGLYRNLKVLSCEVFYNLFPMNKNKEIYLLPQGLRHVIIGITTTWCRD